MKSGFVESSFERHGAGGLEVVWRFEEGTLRLTANFAEALQPFVADAAATLLWQSDKAGATSGLEAWTARITSIAA